MIYVWVSDLEEQWITGSTTYLEWLIDRVENIFHSLIGLNEWNLLSASRIEKEQNIFNAYEIYLKYPNVTALTSINWVVIDSWDYQLLWQKLILKDSVSVSDTFPYLLTLIYVAWYTTTPDDIKQILYSLASYINNSKNIAWISSFSQDLLTVNYGSKEIKDYLESIWQSAIINKYLITYAYS